MRADRWLFREFSGSCWSYLNRKLLSLPSFGSNAIWTFALVEQAKVDPTGPSSRHGAWVPGNDKQPLWRDPAADKGPLDQSYTAFGEGA